MSGYGNIQDTKLRIRLKGLSRRLSRYSGYHLSYGVGGFLYVKRTDIYGEELVRKDGTESGSDRSKDGKGSGRSGEDGKESGRSGEDGIESVADRGG